MKPIYIAILCLFAAGCSTDPVYLKHSESGQIVQCGPFSSMGLRATAAALHENQCIADYQRQGYERVPSPQ